MSANKKIHIITGATVFHITPHLVLGGRAYGRTGAQLATLCAEIMPALDVVVHRTRMAGGSRLETNRDVAELIGELKHAADTKIVFMPVSLCDFEVTTGFAYPGGGVTEVVDIGKDAPRFSSKKSYELQLEPAAKIVSGVRQGRKDIFLVAFKTTHGATEDEQYIAGLQLLKGSSCNLVLANDTSGRHMVITPEEARYHVTLDREEALRGLVEMAALRSHLTFTHSTVVAGEPVPWSSELVPTALRAVVDYCIAERAYKPFNGATVGHFAVKLSEDEFLTSRRKTNFNDLDKIGLVKIRTDGPDTVIAYGSKPSVGGQSQRIVFAEHPAYDCIVHFHCPIKPGSAVPIVSQREYECGSHECGRNTSRGLQTFSGRTNSWAHGSNGYHEWDAVYLDEHGPNIVFHHSIDPTLIMRFIADNFELGLKTGGYVTLPAMPPQELP